MKPHPRIRKTIKWGGAAVTVLLAVLWIGSGWLSASWTPGGGNVVGVGEGRLVIAHMPGMYRSYSASRMSGHLSVHSLHLRWWRFEFATEQGNWFFKGSLWPFVFASAIATAIAWRFDRLARGRERSNFCPKCKYDRTGIVVGARCPECGAEASADPHPRTRKAIKWGCAGLSAALVALWIASLWWKAWIGGTHIGAMVRYGGIAFLESDHEQNLSWGVARSRSPEGRLKFRWWFQDNSNDSMQSYFVPLWVFIVPVALGTVLVWRSNARRRASLAADAVHPERGAAHDSV